MPRKHHKPESQGRGVPNRRHPMAHEHARERPQNAGCEDPAYHESRMEELARRAALGLPLSGGRLPGDDIRGDEVGELDKCRK